MLSVVNKKKVKPLTKKERLGIIKTRLQQSGEIKMKSVSDMTNEELLKLDQDVKDTLIYVRTNEKSYGVNYQVALNATKLLEAQVNQEKQKRGL